MNNKKKYVGIYCFVEQYEAVADIWSTFFTFILALLCVSVCA